MSHVVRGAAVLFIHVVGICREGPRSIGVAARPGPDVRGRERERLHRAAVQVQAHLVQVEPAARLVLEYVSGSCDRTNWTAGRDRSVDVARSQYMQRPGRQVGGGKGATEG